MHPLGAPLGPEHRLDRVRVARSGGQPVDRVGRHHGHAAGAQHLGGGHGAFGVGAHDPHGRYQTSETRAGAPAQSLSGRMGAATRAGSERQSTPGTSM